MRDPMMPERYEIRKITRDTDDTFTFELMPVEGEGIRPFLPGQFNMLYVFGTGEVPISISGDPGKPDRLIHTIRAVGTVTKKMARLKRGGVVGVRGPYGRPWPVERAVGGDVVIVAGGIGLAPLRPVIHHLTSRRADYGRVVLLYGTRSPADILYRQELERWRARLDLDVSVTVDRANADWRGSVGLVTTLIGRAPFDPERTTAMVCGPEVMMRYTVDELRRRAVDPSQIFLSMERNMKCAVGFCGHCQFGPAFVCRDGAVFASPIISELLTRREV
ncbi:MAG: Ni/Fe hydrogenase subunit gamma [Acidobacteria bacterium]|nr:Ni/Fe hydrogenase subunit gamma [Acidobacteriota bacterium]